VNYSRGSEINVLFVLGRSSVDRYIRALAVCNGLAEIASQGSEAEFVDRIDVLMRLKKRWAEGRTDVRVVCGSDDAEDETVDNPVSSVDIESISLQSILSHNSVSESQPVLVLCSKNGMSGGMDSEYFRQQTEHYTVFPSLLTVPSAHAGEFHICKIFKHEMYLNSFCVSTVLLNTVPLVYFQLTHLGHLCVWWDVKPYSINQSISSTMLVQRLGT